MVKNKDTLAEKRAEEEKVVEEKKIGLGGRKVEEACEDKSKDDSST